MQPVENRLNDRTNRISSTASKRQSVTSPFNYCIISHTILYVNTFS